MPRSAKKHSVLFLLSLISLMGTVAIAQISCCIEKDLPFNQQFIDNSITLNKATCENSYLPSSSRIKIDKHSANKNKNNTFLDNTSKKNTAYLEKNNCYNISSNNHGCSLFNKELNRKTPQEYLSFPEKLQSRIRV